MFSFFSRMTDILTAFRQQLKSSFFLSFFNAFFSVRNSPRNKNTFLIFCPIFPEKGMKRAG